VRIGVRRRMVGPTDVVQPWGLVPPALAMRGSGT
jgi:hypothetical protein